MTLRPKLIPADALHETDLHAALAGAQIHALYQPIVRMHDRCTVGVEALARLHHPAHGTLSPHLFVPPMERAGLARPLTEAVVRRIFADWGADALDRLDLTLSINFPLDVLLVPEALNWLECMRQHAGIAATRLIIELTESQPLSRLPELAATAHRLRDIGYGLAIDDVGPDTRDHGALLALPFTMLKLDKDVVRETAVTPAARLFLAGAVAAAHDAGLVVTAEGVEDEACWGRMNALGIEFAQGFLFGRPVSAEAMLERHRKWNGSNPQ